MSRGPEALLQKAVKHLYVLAGAEMYDLSQGYRPDPGGTRQTPGIPDLYGFLPVSFARAQDAFWHEVKTPEGLAEHYRLIGVPAAAVKKAQEKKWARAIAQQKFRDHCKERGMYYAIGGVEDAKELLLRVGLAYKDERGVVFIGKRRAA